MKEVEIKTSDDFDPKKIFGCGQCFRWNENPDGSFTGVAMGKAARLRREGDRLLISGTRRELEEIWHGYFDLDRDYRALRRSVCIDDYMRAASDFGAGIRILNQDRWETLCSFLLSQCNNIPRIKKIVEALCALYGDEITFNGRKYFSFPGPERLAALEPEDLLPIRCGYRGAGSGRPGQGGYPDGESRSDGPARDRGQGGKLRDPLLFAHRLRLPRGRVDEKGPEGPLPGGTGQRGIWRKRRTCPAIHVLLSAGKLLTHTGEK